MRRWRKMTWVLVIWCAIILIWAIAGGSNAANTCHGTYTQACQAGTGIGVAIVLLIGFFGFLFFGLIWFMTRPRGRDCPVCGEFVKRGQVSCKACGHDFRAASGAPAATG